MCVGHKAKMQREEYFQRELNYNIVRGWAAKPPNKKTWWPIEGEEVKKIKMPSRKRLEQIDILFRNLGKRKNG